MHNHPNQQKDDSPAASDSSLAGRQVAKEAGIPGAGTCGTCKHWEENPRNDLKGWCPIHEDVTSLGCGCESHEKNTA